MRVGIWRLTRFRLVFVAGWRVDHVGLLLTIGRNCCMAQFGVLFLGLMRGDSCAVSTAHVKLAEAAPDLLAALEAVLPDLLHGHTGECAVWIEDADEAVTGYAWDKCNCEFGARRAAARAAIAKVEGRS